MRFWDLQTFEFRRQFVRDVILNQRNLFCASVYSIIDSATNDFALSNCVDFTYAAWSVPQEAVVERSAVEIILLGWNGGIMAESFILSRIRICDCGLKTAGKMPARQNSRDGCPTFHKS